MMIILIMITISFSMLFFLYNTPFSMGINLIIQTMILSIIMGFTFKTFWFSYILMLVFIGAMLILFLYVITLTTNITFKLNTNYLILSSLMILFIIMNYDSIMFIINTSMIMPIKFLELSQEESLLKIFSSYSNKLLIFMVNYLFLMLIAIENIINMSFGPLRKMT